jgi:hypothetical protein
MRLFGDGQPSVPLRNLRPKEMPRSHVLEGKDDLSERLSLIQISGRFSNLRHGKRFVHYRPVLLLSG